MVQPIYQATAGAGQHGAGQLAGQRHGGYEFIQMLAYTTWHYGKPALEMGGTLIWGIAAAAIALRIHSLWPIVIAHWLYNVVLDVLIWKRIPQAILG